MATPDARTSTGALQLHAFSGARAPLPEGTQVLYTVMDGYQKTLLRGYYPPDLMIQVPFHDNFGDNYTVVAWAKDYEQAGVTPVKIKAGVPSQVSLMLLRKNAEFDFSRARWDLLSANHPQHVAILSAGAADATTAQERYAKLMEDRPAVLACLFNVVTAMSDVQLGTGTAIGYLKELIWDGSMTQDHFFAWADPALVSQIVSAAESGQFNPEAGTALFHPGATRSWKQVQFGEANVKITLYENDTRRTGDLECIKVELGFDYFKDLASHALLEVIVNTLTGSLTDPRDVYRLRWIAGRQAGAPDFDPPYILD